jgi:glycosylphosphatidylinositol transamidase (GPIT) subunit GPI8
MKKLLLLPLLLSNTLAQEGSFRGTVFDLDSGRVQVIRGEIEKPYQPYQPQIDAYRRIIADTQASIDRMRAESEARAQLRELREQTELLRKIANE